MKKWNFLILFALSSLLAKAETADFFMRSGNYYVVAGVLIIILLGLLIYLFRIDARLTKLEKKRKS